MILLSERREGKGREEREGRGKRREGKSREGRGGEGRGKRISYYHRREGEIES